MINNPVIIITGSSQGLGKRLREYYINKKMTVIGCSRGPVNDVNSNYYHYTLDVVNEHSVKKVFKEVRQRFGRLDFLINNAGVASKNYAELTSINDIQNVINTNFLGSFIFSRESIKMMKKNKFGRIINISSIHVPLGSTGTSIYGASKAAIEQFSKVLSREIYHYGITVNTLYLSIVKDTGMEDDLNEETKSQILKNTISGKKLNKSDVINVLDFLMSHKTQMITNQTIALGGV